MGKAKYTNRSHQKLEQRGMTGYLCSCIYACTYSDSVETSTFTSPKPNVWIIYQSPANNAKVLCRYMY